MTRAVKALIFNNSSLILLAVLNLQNLKMTDCKKTMTGNSNTWKKKDLIAPCHLNIVMERKQQFNYLNSFDHQITAVQGEYWNTCFTELSKFTYVRRFL